MEGLHIYRKLVAERGDPFLIFGFRDPWRGSTHPAMLVLAAQEWFEESDWRVRGVVPRMDPDACLEQLEQALREIDELSRDRLDDPDTLEALANVGRVVTERAEALNEWVGDGGFLPRKWDPHGRT